MKKIFSAFAFLLLAACNFSGDDLDHRTYRLQGTPDDAVITISFNTNKGQYAGKSGVNRYFGRYKLKGKDLKLSPGGLTMMLGPRHLMKIEESYIKNLETVSSFKRKGDVLTLKTSDGKELIFNQDPNLR